VCLAPEHALGGAVARRSGGVSYTTLETKVNMVRAIQPNSGIYRCEGILLARGRQIITSEAKVTGPDGKLYAHGTSTCMVLRPRADRTL
jgi:acyl-coenzyme A thioesterase PaaI-like protein